MKTLISAPERTFERGLTLFELLVVVVLVAAVSAVVFSVLPRQPYGANVAAEEISHVLQAVRAKALSEGLEAELEIDLDARRLAGAGQSYSLPEGVLLKVQAAGGPAGTRHFSIVFTPAGMATGGRLELMDEMTCSALLVDWLTARVSMGTCEL